MSRPIRQAGKKNQGVCRLYGKEKEFAIKGGHRRFFSFTCDAIGPSTVFVRIANFSYHVRGALVSAIL